MQRTAVCLLAILFHESGRASVAAGNTLAHVFDPTRTRPFVEWSALPEHVQRGRLMTADNLLNRFGIAEPGQGESVDVGVLASAIHEAERDAVAQGLVLVKFDRPWVPLAELPEPAQAGRFRQASYLLERMTIVDVLGGK